MAVSGFRELLPFRQRITAAGDRLLLDASPPAAFLQHYSDPIRHNKVLEPA
jgi:hypothetical protein